MSSCLNKPLPSPSALPPLLHGDPESSLGVVEGGLGVGHQGQLGGGAGEEGEPPQRRQDGDLRVVVAGQVMVG